jgi:hypothetical protein
MLDGLSESMQTGIYTILGFGIGFAIAKIENFIKKHYRK